MQININPITITIDGPAGSGKTTTAKKVAEKLGFLHLDSGALYRAATLKAVQAHLPLTNSDAVTKLVEQSHFDLVQNSGHLTVLLDGQDVTDEIRSPEISQNVKYVAANPGVRRILTKIQRRISSQGPVIAEGRDTGTVVFPEAELKVFMIASLAQRTKRRQIELEQKGIAVDLTELSRQLEARDLSDEQREYSPLKRPLGALTIDTSQMSIEEQVNVIIEEAIKRGIVKR